jgi:nitrite reductase (NO-forming)
MRGGSPTSNQKEDEMSAFDRRQKRPQSVDIEEIIKAATGDRFDRRMALKRAAGLGLAFPVIGALGLEAAKAQDEEHGHDVELGTPEAGYVGSDPTAGSTGDDAPEVTEIQPFEVYDPFIEPVEAGPKEIRVVAEDATLYIAKDVAYAGWTFDGTIPGRVLRVREGDEVSFTFAVAESASTAHSLDTHAAKTPPGESYRTIMPGQEFTWNFVPPYAGAYMYHCGTPPVLMHIGAGMYGAMIVDPPEGWSPAQELCFVQSDFYLSEGENGVMVPDYTKMLGHGTMDYVCFNGYANQYVDNPIKVRVGEPIRIFFVNCGPNVWSTFHVVGAVFDRGYVNANPNNELIGLQSIAVGPGDGACVEFTIDEPGIYPAVNHAFGHAAHGAIALLEAE